MPLKKPDEHLTPQQKHWDNLLKDLWPCFKSYQYLEIHDKGCKFRVGKVVVKVTIE
jgi:hypothetical protein